MTRAKARLKWLVRRAFNDVPMPFGYYPFDFGGIDQPTVWIVGEGRSGTTWLAETLNAGSRYRVLFEPFHPALVPEAKPFGVFHYQHPEADNPALLEYAQRVFSGRVRGQHIDLVNRNLISNGRIVKDIFANLFMVWAMRRFPNVKAVLLLRHPLAVAVSKQHLRNWTWMTEPGEFLKRPDLAADYLDPFRELFAEARSYIEKQVLIWCVAHYVPLRQMPADGIRKVFYEHLCTHPRQELMKLSEYVYGDQVAARLDRMLRRSAEPSRMSRAGGGASLSKAGSVPAWRESVSARELAFAKRALRSFGLDSLYDTDPMPIDVGTA